MEKSQLKCNASETKDPHVFQRETYKKLVLKVNREAKRNEIDNISTGQFCKKILSIGAKSHDSPTLSIYSVRVILDSFVVLQEKYSRYIVKRECLKNSTHCADQQLLSIITTLKYFFVSLEPKHFSKMCQKFLFRPTNSAIEKSYTKIIIS